MQSECMWIVTLSKPAEISQATMAKWILLILSVSLLEVQTNFEPEENYCVFNTTTKGLELNCTHANIHYFQNFRTPFNKTYKISCDDCFLNVLDEYSFNVPRRNNVSVLNLHSARIRVLKKFAFKKFYMLKVLNLRNNSINVLDPLCFHGAKRLIQLDLSNNEMQILTNNLFLDLENLDLLNLNFNQIYHIQPEAFAGLANLKYLYLSDNELTRLEENVFRHLIRLKILHLERNQIVEIHQNAFANLRSLNFLYMNNNSITYLVQYNFKPLTSLLDLQLMYNNLTEIQTSTFNGMKSLKALHLAVNKISLIRRYGFVGLDTLELLDLSYNELKTIWYFDYFSNLENLRYLFLRKNYLSEFLLNLKYEIQSSLSVLDISHNNLDSFNLNLFYSFSKLGEVFVENNPWECDFFTSLLSYFDARNVSVCCSSDCNRNSTEQYAEEICYKPLITENESDDDTAADFALECSVIVSPHALLLVSALVCAICL
nr:unnamed protein product [Callosobruchus chinensis]